MFGSHYHYVPVLKWKRAEQTALGSLAPHIKSRITPLIELVSIPIDLDSGNQSKTLEQHVGPAIQKLASSWEVNAPLFLDPEAVSADAASDGLGGAAYSFVEAQRSNVPFVPVTGLRRAPHDIVAAVAHAGRGLCLRLTPDDLARTTLYQEFTDFFTEHRLSAQDVDVVIDLESVTGQSAFVIAAAASLALRTIPSADVWRTVTVIASAFPEHMGVVDTFSSLVIERSEWKAWLLLHAQREQLPRLPTYGDYGIQHPTGVEGFDPRYMQMAASVRYTLTDQWLLLKGQSTKRQSPSLQYPGLAKQLIAHAAYFGQSHCRGCAEAVSCASGTPGLGSPEAWRRIGTSHHIKVAVGQLGAIAPP
ncbi:beta family protein [Sorangium sp. So ce1000]|uniref:beta family protein n=1 Tax=Sorangium sp. So ce1000 TaxID=3133325 RepID=UPI003F60465D